LVAIQHDEIARILPLIGTGLEYVNPPDL